MNFANIKYDDISNGTGVRVSLFVSGCDNNCKGCFNKEAQDFNYGRHFEDYNLKCILEGCMPDYIEGLSILGGEPLHKKNIDKVLQICKRFKHIYPHKTIWIYSGYLYENLIKSPKFNELCKYIDVLVDGPFIEEQKSLLLEFRGSSNQRIIDILQTQVTGHISTIYK